MNFKWMKAIAKTILLTLVICMAFTVVFIIWIYNDCARLMDSRISDLSLIVAEENCLSKDGSPSAYQSYTKLLEATQNEYLKFNTNKSNTVDMNFSVYVGSPGGSTYYSYVTAPQRGTSIKCTVKGTISVPVFVPLPSQYKYVTIPIEREYIIMGMKFYKGK